MQKMSTTKHLFTHKSTHTHTHTQSWHVTTDSNVLQNKCSLWNKNNCCTWWCVLCRNKQIKCQHWQSTDMYKKMKK